MHSQDAMFSYVALEERIAADHPLRSFRAIAHRALATLSPLSSELYAPTGRESVPPERLLRSLASRLVRASQETGQPIPDLGRGSAVPRKRVDTVEVRRRGKANGFGINIPQEPLERLGTQAGDRLPVVVAKRGRIQLVRGDGIQPPGRL